MKISPDDVLWEKAKILVAISDLRGINDRISFTWNDSTFAFIPGNGKSTGWKNGISLPMPNLSTNDFPGEFQFTLNLKGSESLNFAPLGETTEVTLNQNGMTRVLKVIFCLQNTTLTTMDLQHSWKILNFNRNFPQEWKNNEYNVTDADFGVNLVTVADHYQKSSRSAKYAILVILFIFLSFFLNEIITKQKVHPFQYILVGFSVLIFYLLLLSISEQLGFNLAYLISAIAVIIMVFFYSRTFLKKWINSIIQTLILTFSFGFIFVLMQLETYALTGGKYRFVCGSWP